MNFIKYSDGTRIGISPLFDKAEFEFLEGSITEGVMGELPDVNISIKSDQMKYKIGDEHEMKIIYPNGSESHGPIYIYDIKYENYKLNISYLGCNPKFTRDYNTSKVTDIKDALGKLYGSEVITNSRSDEYKKTTIYQMNESDYKFCSNLALSFKENSVFAYTLGALRICDLKNDTFKMKIANDNELKKTSPLEYSKSSLFDSDPEIIEVNNNDNHFCYIKYNNIFSLINSDYKQLLKNRIYNKRLSESQGIANYQSVSLLPIEITDKVKFVNERREALSNMYLAQRVITFGPGSISVCYSFKTINPFKQE